jgi:transcriptional regulator with XRE-family HTH domain
MTNTGISQPELARFSGVREVTISQFLSDKTDLSNDLLDRLMSSLGYRLEIHVDGVPAELTQSERRSWVVHRQLATHLTPSAFDEWQPTMLANIDRLRETVHGEPHIGSLSRWQHIAESRDLAALRRMLIGIDSHAIEMRDVSPMSGLLSDDERQQALSTAT